MNEQIDIKQMLKDIPLEQFNGAICPQETLNIDENQINALYKDAYDLYEDNQFTESRERFSELVTLNPWNTTYWMGLAASLHLEVQLEPALQAYAVAGLLNDKDPHPHFYAAQCLTSLNQPEEAKKALNEAFVRSNGHYEYLSLMQRIRIMQNQLEGNSPL
ncbi:MAG: SycD/LcrH family type III secretion system chaperone [Parachlamydiales bacterium]|nr:SycD/LcrH family type III secretion system chaperone [Parachlamydiales bacterium]